MLPVLKTQRLILRPPRPQDRHRFAEINANSKVCEFFPTTLHRAESDALMDRIEHHFRTFGYGLFMVEVDGQVQGFIGLNIPRFGAPFMPTIELGWRLHPDVWGQGLATEGARRVIEFAFEELNLGELVSLTIPTNLRSRRVMEKLGFTLDPNGQFEHPLIEAGHPMRPHVLYRLNRSP